MAMTTPTRVTATLALCALSSSPALAQVPDYSGGAATPAPTDMPAPRPAKAGGYWLPGQPMPIAGQNSANNPLNDSGGIAGQDRGPATPPGSARGTGEAVLRPEDMQSTGVSVDDPHAGDPDRLPEKHLVRKGDTLWDLSQSYFRNPWYWPKLWAQNPVITNPHWIYPGDVLRLRPPEGSAPRLPASMASAGMPMKISKDGLVDSGLHLRQTGFVEPGELRAAGTISASKEEKIMLTTLDEAYVRFDEGSTPKVGERYSIYRVERNVKRQDGEMIGAVVLIVGELEIRTAAKGMSRAVIVEANNPIERGFRVGPLRRRFDMVEAVPDTEDVDARVAAALVLSEMMGEAQVLFIDRGRDDGLKVGNRLMVVRRGDGYQPRMRFIPEEDKRFPRELLGEILLVDVRGKTSTAVVLRSIHEVEVGDHVEARKGY